MKNMKWRFMFFGGYLPAPAIASARKQHREGLRPPETQAKYCGHNASSRVILHVLQLDGFGSELLPSDKGNLGACWDEPFQGGTDSLRHAWRTDSQCLIG